MRACRVVWWMRGWPIRALWIDNGGNKFMDTHPLHPPDKLLAISPWSHLALRQPGPASTRLNGGAMLHSQPLCTTGYLAAQYLQLPRDLGTGTVGQSAPPLQRNCACRQRHPLQQHQHQR